MVNILYLDLPNSVKFAPFHQNNRNFTISGICNSDFHLQKILQLLAIYRPTYDPPCWTVQFLGSEHLAPKIIENQQPIHSLKHLNLPSPNPQTKQIHLPMTFRGHVSFRYIAIVPLDGFHHWM